MNDGVVLIVTAKDEHSVPRVISFLQEIGQPFFRLDTDGVIENGVKITLRSKGNEVEGAIVAPDQTLELNTVKSVWFRRPKNLVVPANVTDELTKQFIDDEYSSTLWSLYTCMGEAFQMNDPHRARYLFEHNKMIQLKLASHAGLTIPETLVTNDADQMIDFCEKQGGQVAIKAVRSRIFQKPDGSAEGIYTNLVSTDFIKDRVGSISHAPIMVQQYVPKKLEFRVTVVGSEIFACAIRSQDSEMTKVDWRHYDFEHVKHEPYDLPEFVKKSLLKFMKLCQLSFGAIDMVLTPNEQYVFLEINPSGQFGWIEGLTKLPISETIAKTLAKGR